jgi:hypothetical protein
MSGCAQMARRRPRGKLPAIRAAISMVTAPAPIIYVKSSANGG